MSLLKLLAVLDLQKVRFLQITSKTANDHELRPLATLKDTISESRDPDVSNIAHYLCCNVWTSVFGYVVVGLLEIEICCTWHLVLLNGFETQLPAGQLLLSQVENHNSVQKCWDAASMSGIPSNSWQLSSLSHEGPTIIAHRVHVKPT